MLNMYVHAQVLGLPADILDDEFVERFWAEMPDASIGTHHGVFGVTVSQFALSDHRARPRQLERIRLALAAIGCPGAVVLIEEIVREGWRDEVQVLVGIVRWQWWRLTVRLGGCEKATPAA